MANETKKQTNDTTLPLWRVTYTYVVKYQQRQGAYIIPANHPQEAEIRAAELLVARFANTGPYKVTGVKPF